MSEMKNGIALMGNILTDIVKHIDSYPKIGMLSNITRIERAVGGCVPNVGIDLRKMDPTLRVAAVGQRGNDEVGDYVVGELQRYGLDTTRVCVTDDAPTGFTDVMTLPTGERTFFHSRGANASFTPDAVELDRLDVSLLHFGYILLMDSFDARDAEYGTVLARFLHAVRERGIKTSVDCVSDTTADYAEKILPALRYADYAIVNEIEATSIYGVEPYDADGRIRIAAVHDTMRRMMASGVREKVIVHCRDAGFCLSADGTFTAVPSLRIPSSEIRGSCGAGDAYCAASLYGIYHDWDDRRILEFAASAAACNLFSANSVDGMRPLAEIEKMPARYGFLPMPD